MSPKNCTDIDPPIEVDVQNCLLNHANCRENTGVVATNRETDTQINFKNGQFVFSGPKLINIQCVPC